jgi:hypothetical protein
VRDFLARKQTERVRRILTEELDMKVCAKIVPKELTKEQNNKRVFT